MSDEVPSDVPMENTEVVEEVEEEVVDDVDDDIDDGSEDSLDDTIRMLRDRGSARAMELEQLRKIVRNKDPEERTLYVGQIDLSTLPEELYEVFRDCGDVEKINILPGGYGYVEFEDVSGAEAGLKRHNINWRGLRLQVCPKRMSSGGSPCPRLDTLGTGLGIGRPSIPAAGVPIQMGADTRGAPVYQSYQ
eukprot:TRINITY_DN5974_c0_g1_i2.p1 TRINITY_DN5974_c0_g1~~TRINITY_DN5974_c0_g1_i2.p1  ORF type:complete len:191 (+),score=46.92 TRINITY_DN5974_c0_g1_i2:39-611(+)